MSTRSDGSTSAELVTLQADARYARERYQLYKARTYGPRPSDPTRLRKLERTCLQAEQRLSRAKSRAESTAEHDLEGT